jgi:alpha-L-fucosidase 2
MKKQLLSFFLFCVAIGFSQDKNNFPKEENNLILQAPINSWDEAIPLGNGLTGGLLWGEKNLIRLSLDRGDLWDERTNGPKEWWKTQTWAKGGNMWEDAYYGATPTKLPAGAVEFTLTNGTAIKSFVLNKKTAEGIVHFENEQQARVFFSAVKSVAVMRIPVSKYNSLQVMSAMQVSEKYRGRSAGPDSHTVKSLGYPDATNGAVGNTKWYVQEASEGLTYCVFTETRQIKDEMVTAIAVTTNHDGDEPLKLAKSRCTEILNQGINKSLSEHTAWWKNFWSQSQINLPEKRMQDYYTFARYLYGAGSRANTPPMPLQGVWTSATGSLPPWKGDYHSDLNTQMTYSAYQEAGNFEEGSSYINFLWNKRDVWRAFAKDFYGTNGLAVPGVMTVAGQPLGGWAAYSLSPTMTSWNAHLFYLHWLYTADDTFLKERAYPWCKEAAECLRALLKPDANGNLKLLRSSSPEIFDNHWLVPNSNYDLMSIKMHFLAVAEMAEAQKLTDEAKLWKDLAAKLGDFHVASDGELMLDSKLLLRESHRHLSNIIGIYPFNLITVEGSKEDQRRINTTLNRPEWNARKHNEWCGYSWAWMACMQARVGNAESAYHHLDVFEKAYILRNGFHVNQDQTPDSRYGNGGGKPFTLEGNFIAMQAVQEMLLQSWNPTPGKVNSGVIRIFPATPKEWADVSFTDLRAEGGYKISATRKEGKISLFSVTAKKVGTVRIKDNFNGKTPKWNMEKVKKTGDIYEINLKVGEKLEAKF